MKIVNDDENEDEDCIYERESFQINLDRGPERGKTFE